VSEPLRGDWDDLVVFCAGTSWDGTRGVDRHLAERLANFAPVLYVDPPQSLLTRIRNPHLAGAMKESPLRLIAPGLARLTPRALPGKGRPGIRRITETTTPRAVRRAIRELGGSVRAVVVGSLDPMFSCWPSARKVLYGSDDFVAGAELMGLSSAWVARCERARLDEADVVIACSPTLADKWRAMGFDARLVPNGVDAAAFALVDGAPWPDDVRLPSPIVGLVGHLSDRIDLGMLEAVAARGCSLLLVGPRDPAFAGDRVEGLLARPNVQWVGRKAFGDLPSYLKAIDVGIVPYCNDAFNRASFPLKTLEYLASGRPVVTSDLPAFRWLNTDLVTIVAGAEQFADVVMSALASPGDADATVARRAFAAEHSWDRRAELFARHLDLRVGATG
jgi:teichuronic acid biosynthesis glycosyltransferase TuaH